MGLLFTSFMIVVFPARAEITIVFILVGDPKYILPSPEKHNNRQNGTDTNTAKQHQHKLEFDFSQNVKILIVSTTLKTKTQIH